MLLFDPLYDALVSVFIKHPQVSTQELHTYISKEYDISLPNLYKIIGQLLDKQILIKKNGMLSLYSRRIRDFCDIAEELKTTYLQTPLRTIDLKEGEIINFQANSVKEMDGIRGEISFNIYNVHEATEPMYVYHSHPYYSLGMYETEMAFFSAIQKRATAYLLFSDTCFLDVYGSELYKKAGIKNVVISKKHPFLQDGYFINIIGDYILEFIYPQSINEFFKVFFSSVHNIKQFNKELFGKIFEMKGECKITLRRNKKDAEMFKKEIMKYFK